MGADELFDDEALDPKELFDESKYSTLIVNRDGFTIKQNATADSLERILEKDVNREELEEIFKVLKENKAGGMLTGAIKNTSDPQKKSKLIAAFWESDLEMGEDFLYFVRLACDDDMLIALEALTVIENCSEKMRTEVLEAGMQIAMESKSKNKEMVSELKQCLKDLAGI